MYIYLQKKRRETWCPGKGRMSLAPGMLRNFGLPRQRRPSAENGMKSPSKSYDLIHCSFFYICLLHSVSHSSIVPYTVSPHFNTVHHLTSLFADKIVRYKFESLYIVDYSWREIMEWQIYMKDGCILNKIWKFLVTTNFYYCLFFSAKCW